MGNDCRECLAGRPHCHGTLIRHSTAHRECTDQNCFDAEYLLHSLTMDCGAVGCDCNEDNRGRRAV